MLIRMDMVDKNLADIKPIECKRRRKKPQRKPANANTRRKVKEAVSQAMEVEKQLEQSDSKMSTFEQWMARQQRLEADQRLKQQQQHQMLARDLRLSSDSDEGDDEDETVRRHHPVLKDVPVRGKCKSCVICVSEKVKSCILHHRSDGQPIC